MNKLYQDIIYVILSNLNYIDVLSFYSCCKKYYEYNQPYFYKFSIIDDIIKSMTIVKQIKPKFSTIYNERYQLITTKTFDTDDKDFFVYVKIHLGGLMSVKDLLKKLLINPNSAKYKWMCYINETFCQHGITCSNEMKYHFLRGEKWNELSNDIDIKHIIAVIPFRKDEYNVDSTETTTLKVIIEKSNMIINKCEEKIKDKFYKLLKEKYEISLEVGYQQEIIKIFSTLNDEEQDTLYKLSNKIYSNILGFASCLYTNNIDFSVEK